MSAILAAQVDRPQVHTEICQVLTQARHSGGGQCKLTTQGRDGRIHEVDLDPSVLSTVQLVFEFLSRGKVLQLEVESEVSVRRAAKILGVKVKALQELVDEGQVRTVGRNSIPADDVVRYLREGLPF